MGYPLVPGYEAVGRVVEAGPQSDRRPGQRVFVPGSRAYKDVRGLFGGAAAHLIVGGARAMVIDEALAENGTLIALAATAHHALALGRRPELIVGHGVLGRLLARLCVATGGPPPTVWESRADRAFGAKGYDVVDCHDDARRDYTAICDVSGDATLLDELISRLAPGGELMLAGFYSAPMTFAFPPAFMREAAIRVAAQWRDSDLQAVKALIDDGKLSLDRLISHRAAARDVENAYRAAFEDPACLKMILDWRTCS
jgi:3-hydroxyethyl bacteriochlorophyllide a dehydrogenase